MGGTARPLALAGIGAVLLVLLSVTPAAASPDCTESEGVVGVVADQQVEESHTVYAGSSMDIALCEDGSIDTQNWFRDDEHTGLAIEEREGGVVTVTVTDDSTVVSPDGEDTLEVTVLGEAMDVGTESIYGANATLLERYNTEVTRHDEILENLSTMTETYDETGEVDLEWAESNLTALQALNDDIADTEAELREHLSADVQDGGIGGGTAVLTALDDEREQRATAAENVTESYNETVLQDQDGSTAVTLPVGGSLAAGLVLGAIVGAAIPLSAARRIERTRRLSSSVTYERRVLLIPVVVGGAAIVAGLAVLALFGGGDLLEVIR